MKNLKFIATLLFPILLLSCATVNVPLESVSAEKIIDVSGVEQDELYIRVNSWFVENFNSAESVIEFSDKEAGRVVGKFTFEYVEGMYIRNTRQTVDVQIKDEKVKIEIKHPASKLTRSTMSYNRFNQSYKPLDSKKRIDRARLEWDELISSLELHVKQDSSW